MTLRDGVDDIDRDLFLTAVLGFLLGLRLVPEGIGHLQRIRHTARTGVMPDAGNSEIADIMEAMLQYWAERGSSVCNRIFRTIHQYLITEVAYTRQFEAFCSCILSLIRFM